MATIPLTDSCTTLGCTEDHLVCHRCGQAKSDVAVRYLAKPLGTWSVAGAQPKVVAHATHGCAACVDEWATLVAAQD